MYKSTVIVLHYKGTHDTIDCLNSLYKANELNKFNIIVVDNSEDQSFPKRKYPDIIFINSGKNSGFAGGMNIGIKRAFQKGTDSVILLNNDTIVERSSIFKLTQYAKDNKDIGLISPKIYFAPGSEYHFEKYGKDDLGKVIWYAGGIIDWKNIYACHRGVDEIDEKQFDSIMSTDFATGCCMLISKEAYQKVGYFDENYFLYFEDIDYSVRTKKAGLNVIYYPKSHIWHKNASSSGKPGSDMHIYYLTRNRLYFGYKYASLWERKSLFIDSIRLIGKKESYRKAIGDYYFRKMGMETK